MFQVFTSVGNFKRYARLFSISLSIIAACKLSAAPRNIGYSDPQLYYELAYEALLFWGGPKFAKSLERPEGSGIQRMPWQALDDRVRDILHPYDYADGPLSKEKHWNQNASLFSKSLIYPTLVTPFFQFSTDEWLGSFLTIAHCIETSFHVSRALRAAVGRYRPRVVYRDEVIFDDEKKNSFPSGHAGEAFAWATTAVLVLDLPLTWQILAYSSASLASLGRLPGGQHYFTDLLAGAAVGSGVSYAAYHASMSMVSDKEQADQKVSYSLGPNFVKFRSHPIS